MLKKSLGRFPSHFFFLLWPESRSKHSRSPLSTHSVGKVFFFKNLAHTIKDGAFLEVQVFGENSNSVFHPFLVPDFISCPVMLMRPVKISL